MLVDGGTVAIEDESLGVEGMMPDEAAVAAKEGRTTKMMNAERRPERRPERSTANDDAGGQGDTDTEDAGGEDAPADDTSEAKRGKSDGLEFSKDMLARASQLGVSRRQLGRFRSVEDADDYLSEKETEITRMRREPDQPAAEKPQSRKSKFKFDDIALDLDEETIGTKNVAAIRALAKAVVEQKRELAERFGDDLDGMDSAIKSQGGVLGETLLDMLIADAAPEIKHVLGHRPTASYKFGSPIRDARAEMRQALFSGNPPRGMSLGEYLDVLARVRYREEINDFNEEQADKPKSTSRTLPGNDARGTGRKAPKSPESTKRVSDKRILDMWARGTKGWGFDA